MNKFKTIVTPNGEFGILDVSMLAGVFIGTSSKPHLYDSSTKLEDLKPVYESYPLSGEDRNFDWDKDFPKDWVLVECTIMVNE